jgi:hypothetical protein
MTILTLGVSDLEKVRGFYLDGLGWKEASNSSEEITFIEMNGFILALYPHDALAADATVPEDRSQFRGFALAYNTRSRDEVEEVLAFAETAGAKIVKPAQEAFWGGYSGYFSDPDGFLWEVAYNPSLTP